MAQKKIQGITAKLKLDSSGVTSALDEIDQKSKKVASEMKEVDSALKLNPDSTVLMSQKQELLAEAVENTAKKLHELESVSSQMDKAFAANPDWERQYEPLKQAIDETRNKLKELRNQNDKVEEDFKSGKISAEAYEEYKRSVDETKNKLKELIKQRDDLEASFESGHISADEYRAYQREVENTRSKLHELQRSQDDAKQSADKMGDQVEKTGENLKNGAGDAKKYEDSLKELSDAASNVRDDISKIGEAAGKVVGAIGTAAVAGITSATKVGADFEKSMSTVQALSGATSEEYDALSEAAQRMGATTSKTAAESADALGYMALAGWDTEQMLEGLEPILRASEAGGTDLARTSDLVTDSMSAMGVSTEELAHYLDVVTKAQSSSNTSMEQALEAYIGAGGMFKQLNVPMEESAAILGVLANRGIKGSEAGTALNSILVNLVGANKNAASALDDLGISAWDSEGNFIGLSETLKKLEGALENCTDEQKAMLEAQIGGKTQMDTLQALISGVSEEYDGLYDSLTKADGALLETAKTMQDNLTGDITTFGSALEDLGIKIYDKFREPFREAVQTATTEISKLSKSANEGELAESLERIAEKLSELLKNASEFVSDKGIPALINALDWLTKHGKDAAAIVEAIGAGWLTWKISGMAGHLVQLITALKDFTPAAAGATTQQNALNTAMKANIYATVATLVITLATAIGKLIAVQIDEAAALKKENDKLSETTQAVIDSREAYEDLLEAAEANREETENNAAAAENYWKQLQKMVDEQGNVTGSTEEVQDVLNRLNEVAGTNIELVDGQIQGYADLSKTMNDYLESMRRQAVISHYSEAYGEAAANIDEATKKYNEAKHNRLVAYARMKEAEVAARAYEERGEGVSTNSQYMQLLDDADREAALMTEYHVQEGEWKKIVDDYQGTIDKMNNLLKEQREAEDKLKENGENVGEAVGEGVSDGVSDSGSDIADSIETTVADSSDTAASAGEEIGEAIAEGVAEGIENNSGEISDAVSSAVTTDTSEAGKKTAEEIKDGITEGIDTVIRATSKGVSDKAQTMASELQALSASIFSMLPNMSGISAQLNAQSSSTQTASNTGTSQAPVQTDTALSAKLDKIIALLELIATTVADANGRQKYINFSADIPVTVNIDSEKLSTEMMRKNKQYRIITNS